MTPRSRHWSSADLDRLLGGTVVVARDRSAAAVPLPHGLGTGAAVADEPWDHTVRRLPPVDGAEVIRTWWRALSDPGGVHAVEIRREHDAGWTAERLTMVNLLEQQDWGVVLVGIEQLGDAAPPETDGAGDGIGARADRPAWFRQELDPRGIVLHTEGHVEEIFGRSPAEIQGELVLAFLHPEDHVVAAEAWTSLLAEPGGLRLVEQRVLRPDGGTRWIESRLVNGLGPDGSGSVTSLSHDIDERRRRELGLLERAQMDTLTAVLNRHAIYERLRAMIDGGAVTVGFVDLDDFKDVNDSLGHAAGDQVLAVVARRLADGLGDDVHVGRWGGDEFLVVAEGRRASLDDEVVGALDGVIRAGGGEWMPRASIGVVVGDRGEDPGRLVGRADAAMYSSKRAPSGRTHDDAEPDGALTG